MRITSPDVKNELTINDPISGGQITLYYRLPTTQERLKYNQSLFQRKGNKITYTYTEARLKWGREILLGFEEGAFGVMSKTPPGGKGKEVPYSSDPESKNYREDWKDLVCEFASDLIEVLAAHVFEGATPAIVPRFENEEDESASPGAGEMGIDEKN
jgi:hypothetical protein